jgi:hypothetical protein
VAVFAATAFWPTLDVCTYPRSGFAEDYARTLDFGFVATAPRQVPADLVHDLVRAESEGVVGAVWRRRAWYPYVLALPWALALLLVSGVGGAGRRRWVGAALWLLCLAVAAFEAAYLRSDYASFLPGALGRAEAAAVWLFVVFLLFYRRKADFGLGAVEATVAAQALLGFAHLATLPSSMARAWFGTYDMDCVTRAVLGNFPPAFWIGGCALLLVALPVYLRRAPPAVAEGR